MNTVLKTKFRLCDSASSVAVANFPHLLIVKFSPAVGTTFGTVFFASLRVTFPARAGRHYRVQDIPRVRYILFRRDVLKVYCARVGSYPVNVVDLISGRAGAEKGRSDQYMHNAGLWLALSGQRNKKITRRADAGSQDARRFARTSPLAFIPANATKARDAIDTFVPDNGSPFFGFKFNGGKFWNSQDVNLHRQVSFWSDPFGCINSRAGRSAF